MTPRATGRPVLFVTGHAPPDRVGAFARLHELEGVEFALFGGPSQHGGYDPGTGAADDPRAGAAETLNGAVSDRAEDLYLPFHPEDLDLPFPHRHVRQREVAALAAAGRHRAVVVSTGGRLALPGAWAATRRAGIPLILWSSLWAHPRTAAHLLGYPALRRLYRSADAVVTYGPHVSAYVRARGASNVHVAPQSVENDFWGAPGVGPPTTPRWPSETDVKFLFAGRPVREKGLGVLIEAWRDSGLVAPAAALVLVGVGSIPPWIPAGGAVTCVDPVPPTELRSMYDSADILVVPSITTRTFREPWGLVVNEAMNRNLPVIASDAVGAVAGGLVRDGHNGLVVPAGDPRALAHALRRLAADAPLRARLGAAGARDVGAYTHDAWARGFSRALESLGLSRAPDRHGLSSGERW
jgi:glycosyltransferase involved in cell wall biosynthesis